MRKNDLIIELMRKIQKNRKGYSSIKASMGQEDCTDVIRLSEIRMLSEIFGEEESKILEILESVSSDIVS